jgi:murein DD-endopeptidase MepM/ murein hydrolase activator NlpD
MNARSRPRIRLALGYAALAITASAGCAVLLRSQLPPAAGASSGVRADGPSAAASDLPPHSGGLRPPNVASFPEEASKVEIPRADQPGSWGPGEGAAGGSIPEHRQAPGRLDLARLRSAVGLRAGETDSGWSTRGELARPNAPPPPLVPAAGRVSSDFAASRYHPVLHVRRPHVGIDIAAPYGTPIVAPSGGTVRFAGRRTDGYGQTVEIQHGPRLITRFAHASRLLVQTGEQVQRGQVIAEVGATGIATGPHLHYEVLLDGQRVDPRSFGRLQGGPAASLPQHPGAPVLPSGSRAEGAPPHP